MLCFGDARIVVSSSTNGTTWSTPAPVDNQGEPGHQLMPALTFAEGKLQVIYYDLREDRLAALRSVRRRGSQS